MSDETQTTIAAGTDILTLINTFTCPDVRQNELIEALDRSTREVFMHLDGFISANLHASLDRTHVINYVQWRSVADFDNAQLNPDVQKHLEEVMAIAESADPRLFVVKSVHHA
jgi:Antibiotic biosynthesis monooxygenase